MTPPGQHNFAQYQDDPVGYIRDVLKVTLTPDQTAICESVRKNRYTAAKASHAVGKTFVAASLCNWWYDCWPRNIVYINAPSWPQTLGLTYKQVKKFRLDLGLPGEVLDSGLVRDVDRVRATDHFIKAVNAESAEGFQGEHSAPILIVLDEAVGVPAHIWEAVKGLMTSSDCRLLAIFNPTDEATAAGELCRRKSVNVISISALEHPNIQAELRGERQPFPGACSLLWLTEMLEDECDRSDMESGDTFWFYSTESLRECAETGRPIRGGMDRLYLPNATFQGKVLGLFPTQADQQVIPRGWIENLPGCEVEPEHKPEIGCDVAQYGSDRTTIAARQGPHVLFLKELRLMDNLRVTEALREACRELSQRTGVDPKKVTIRIDVTGGLGTGPYDLLKSEGYGAVPINASGRPMDREQFHNRRSEMWFTLRTRVREKRLDLSKLPRDVRDDLTKELATPKYSVDGGGKKVVEAKKDIKAKLHFSPDLADAVNLAFTESGRWWEDEDLKQWLTDRSVGKPETPKETVPVTGGNFRDFMKGTT